MRTAIWFALAALLALPGEARAVSDNVKKACRHDYTTFCANYEIGSEALRQCMRKADKKLSHACVEALVDAGEISRDEVSRRRAASH